MNAISLPTAENEYPSRDNLTLSSDIYCRLPGTRLRINPPYVARVEEDKRSRISARKRSEEERARAKEISVDLCEDGSRRDRQKPRCRRPTASSSK